MTRRSNWLAGLMALAALLSLLTPAASAAGSTVTLSAAEDFVKLAQDCTLDTWSQGRRVVLANDIDLSGQGDLSIPTFGGTFDGQGHTISGLSLTASGNVQGLFRYIQAGGVVENLTLEGSVTPGDLQDTLGLLAGNNRGTIRNCAVNGTVRGKSTIGGVVGLNEAGGQIINTTFSGSVTGEHYVGGAAGQNYGSILQCVNQGSVNTEAVESEADLDELDQRRWNSTENVPACTDIGGIAGFSTGILQSCRNTGAVGYEHVGYNVGGIAGRQAGYLSDCENQGTILGRKDVGGVLGQLEPEVFLRYEEDTLGRLRTELGTLSDQMDQLLSHLSGIQRDTSDQIHTMTSHASDAQTAAGDLMDAMKEWANGNLDHVNDLTSRISWALEQMTPILETMNQLPGQLDKAVASLQEAIDEAEKAGDLAGEAADDLRACLDDALDAADQMGDAMGHLAESQAALKDALGDPDEVEAALRRFSQGLSQLESGVQDFSSAMSHLRDGITQLPNLGGALDSFHQAVGEIGDAGSQVSSGLSNLRRGLDQLIDALDGSGEALQKALDELKAAAEDLQESTDLLQNAGEHFLDAMDDLEDAGVFVDNAVDALQRAGDELREAFTILQESGDALYEMVKTLAEKPTISFDPIGSTITQQGDALDDAVSHLIDGTNDLNDLLSQSSDTVIQDLKGINQQMRVITDLLRQEEKSDEDPVEDISDQIDSQQQRAGCLSGSKNLGKVSGDVNVAGVVGSMALEYDFDPEDDLTQVGDRSMDVRFQTKAITRACVNQGEVQGKKDDVGGVVGRMDLGQVTGCESYGPVTSSDGSYVGGIAGASWGTIRNSWARCTLSGENYVGGVAGYATTLLNCHTLITVDQGSAYVGAVAGDLDQEGKASGNTFTQTALGGIDGISYTGKAHPVSFEALCAAGAPGTFAQMELRFEADGKEVAVVPFQYGQGIDSLPEIPPKEGYSASWPDIDYSCLTASQTLEAVYTPYTSSLTDGGELPEILVDGSFSTQAMVSHTSQEGTWTDENGHAQQGTLYTVTVEDPLLDAVTYTVHCRLPEEKGGYAVWVQSDQGWTKQDSWRDGSYLLFTSDQDAVTFALAKDYSQIVKYLLAAVVLGAGLVLLLWRRKHRKREDPVQEGVIARLRQKIERKQNDSQEPPQTTVPPTDPPEDPTEPAGESPAPEEPADPAPDEAPSEEEPPSPEENADGNEDPVRPADADEKP